MLTKALTFTTIKSTNEQRNWENRSSIYYFSQKQETNGENDSICL